MTADPPPDSDRYAEVRELGVGGLGRVVAVFDRDLQREVARKDLLADDDDARARFLREARVTARLEHPNIVPVHDLGSDGDRPYYTMRCLEGRTLGDALEDQDLAGRLSLLGHLLDVAQAMAYAHAQGVVHRDLKPDNVMIGAFGETWVVDWGLAGPAGPTAPPGQAAPSGPAADGHVQALDGPRLTHAGRLMGTPAYMSPEQARGEPADERSDVFSVGGMLYTVLTGRPPWPGGAGEALAAAALGEVANPRGDDVPEPLVAIALRALASAPDDRYADAAGVAADLQAWLEGRRVSAYTYSAREALTLLGTRHRRSLLLGTVVLLASLTQAAWTFDAVRQERDAARSAESAMSLSLSDALAIRAQTAAAASDPMTAEAYAVEALLHHRSPLALGVLAGVRAAWTPQLSQVVPTPGGCIHLDVHRGQLLCGGVWGAVWITPSGRELSRWEGHIRALGFAPDGRAALARHGWVGITTPEAGPLREFSAARVRDLSWSSGGELAWVDGRDLVVDGSLVTALPLSEVRSVAWSADGERLVAGSIHARAWVLARDGTILSTLASDSASYAVGLSAARAWIGGLESMLGFEVGSGERRATLSSGAGFVTRFVRFPGGLLGGATDLGDVLLWEPDGTLRARLPLHGHPSADLASDADRLYTGGGRSGIRVWELPPWHASVHRLTEGVAQVVSGEGWIAVRDGAGGVHAWSHPEGRALPLPAVGARGAHSLSAVGPLLVRSIDSARVDVVDPRTGARLRELPVPHGALMVGGRPDGFLVRHPQGLGWVSAEDGLMLSEWASEGVIRSISLKGERLAIAVGQRVEIVDGDLRRQAVIPTEVEPHTVALSADGTRVAWSSRDGVVRVLDRRTDLRSSWTAHEQLVSWLSWRGDRLYSASWDHSIRVWRGGELEASLEGHTDRVSEASWQGDQLWSAGWDRTVRRWDLSVLDRSVDSLREEASQRSGLAVDGARVRFVGLTSAGASTAAP